jgi:HEAT repeat protein
VYARRRGEGLGTSLCSRTRPLDQAGEDIAELNSLGVRGAAEVVDGPILDHFVAGLYSESAEERAKAAEGLGTMGLDREVVVAELSALYERGGPGDRQAAVAALGRYAMLSGGASEALPVFLAGLEDESVDVRLATFFPISRLQSAFGATVPAVVVCLGDTSARVRERALRTLNTMTRYTDVPDAADVVVELLSNDDEKVRSQAVGLLPKLMTRKRAFEAVSPLADDESPLVRAAVAHRMSELSVVPEEAEAILIKALSDTAEKVRTAAVYELCEFEHGGPRAVKALVRAHNDDHWQVRKTSVRALSEMMSRVPEALDALVAATEHEQADVRDAAVIQVVMAGLDPELVLGIAEEALDDPEWDVRRSAMHAFERLGPEYPEAISALIRILQGDDPRMRVLAAAMLGRAGVESTAAFDALTEALTDEDQLVREQAVKALDWIEHTLSNPEPELEEQRARPGGSSSGGGR